MKTISIKEASAMPYKLLKFLTLIAMLKAIPWTIRQLMARYGISKYRIYRYQEVMGMQNI